MATGYIDITNPDGSVTRYYSTEAEAGGGGSEVIVNPTLEGTEDNVTGLEVDETKYAMKYLPLAGGTMTGNLNVGTDVRITENNRNMLARTTGGIALGNINNTITIFTSNDNIAHFRDNSSYNILDTYNTEANPTLAGTEASLTGLKVNGIKYAVGGGSNVHLYRHDIQLNKNDGTRYTCYFTLYTSSATPFTAQTISNAIPGYLNANGVTKDANNAANGIIYGLRHVGSVIYAFYTDFTTFSSIAITPTVNEDNVTQIF